MNYNVMKRPMFKMGGKANSQGTGYYIRFR